MIILKDYFKTLRKCIDIQFETQVYLKNKLPEYNYDPNEIKTFIESLKNPRYKSKDDIMKEVFKVSNWIINNKCAIDDEFLEILEAAGGKYGKAFWKPWKKDHQIVMDEYLSNVLEGEYYEKLREEIIDLFHFVLNLILILPNDVIDDIFNYIGELRIDTLCDLTEDQSKLKFIKNVILYLKPEFDRVSKNIYNLDVYIIDYFNDKIHFKDFIKNITSLFYHEYPLDVSRAIVALFKIWGIFNKKSDFSLILDRYISKNNINKNRWNNGY